MNALAKAPATRKQVATAESGDGSQASAALPPSPRYLPSLLATIAGCFAAFYLLLLVLQGTGNLPPPAFSNSLCLDEKLSFMREHPALSPNLLVIGSSVAWRHIDGESIARISPGTRPLNGAFCGLLAHQSVFVANWLLDRHPSLQQVLMIVAPQDLTGCRQTRDAIFNLRDADDFVYGGTTRWWYYLRYFSPRSLARNASTVKAQRANLIELDPLVFNSFGDGPLNTSQTRDWGFEPIAALDPACFDALRPLADRLQRDGRRLMVVTMPLHPDWKRRVDPDGALLEGMERGFRNALKSTNAEFWDADKQWAAPASSFTDAIHLRWSEAQRFSTALARHLLLPRSDAAARTDPMIPVSR